MKKRRELKFLRFAKWLNERRRKRFYEDLTSVWDLPTAQRGLTSIGYYFNKQFRPQIEGHENEVMHMTDMR